MRYTLIVVRCRFSSVSLWGPAASERQIALQQLGIGCRFVLGKRAVAIPVDLGNHLFGDSHARRKVDLQPDATRFDGHKRRLQILIIPMRENSGRNRK